MMYDRSEMYRFRNRMQNSILSKEQSICFNLWGKYRGRNWSKDALVALQMFAARSRALVKHVLNCPKFWQYSK